MIESPPHRFVALVRNVCPQRSFLALVVASAASPLAARWHRGRIGARTLTPLTGFVSLYRPDAHGPGMVALSKAHPKESPWRKSVSSVMRRTWFAST